MKYCLTDKFTATKVWFYFKCDYNVIRKYSIFLACLCFLCYKSRLFFVCLKVELNTAFMELRGVKINCVVKFSSEIVDYFQNTSLIFAT